MTSKYHLMRNSKRAEDDEAVKAYGSKTWGYDYANDGYRHVVDYNIVQKWLDSQTGRKWNDIWRDAHKKWNNDTYVGKETLDYISRSVERSRWSDYYIEDGILKKRPRKKYVRKKKRPSYIYHSGRLYYINEGIWYEIQFKVPESCSFTVNEYTGDKTYRYYVNDIIYGVVSGPEYMVAQHLYSWWGKFIFAYAKQQVGKKLCKKLNELRSKL